MSDFNVIAELNKQRKQKRDREKIDKQPEQPDLMAVFDGSYLEQRREEKYGNNKIHYMRYAGQKVKIIFQDDSEEEGIFIPNEDKNGVVSTSLFSINKTEYQFHDIKKIAKC